jgi:hypothetical protein
LASNVPWHRGDGSGEGENIVFPVEDPGVVHLAHDYGLMAGHHTLCGFVDIRHMERTREPATCRTCVKAMQHAHEVWTKRKRLVSPELLARLRGDS